MPTATPADDTTANQDPEKPNHMIFWLDAHIGNPTEYIHLKKAFGSNTDPRHETWTMLPDKDFDAMIAAGAAVTVTFEGVVFLLQAFNNEDACLAAFEQNQDKRIFFITSGSMGKEIVPKIIERYRPIFTDKVTDQPYPSVYVFCLHIEYHLKWAMDYIQYVQMFDIESELLERMTRDIAEYFIERGERIRQDNNLEGALQRLYWAKRLWHQYDKMQQEIKTDDLRPVRKSQRMIEIDVLIGEVEAELPPKSSDDENADSDDDGK
jgi:hypothetical protein